MLTIILITIIVLLVLVVNNRVNELKFLKRENQVYKNALRELGREGVIDIFKEEKD